MSRKSKTKPTGTAAVAEAVDAVIKAVDAVQVPPKITLDLEPAHLQALLSVLFQAGPSGEPVPIAFRYGGAPNTWAPTAAAIAQLQERVLRLAAKTVGRGPANA